METRRLNILFLTDNFPPERNAKPIAKMSITASCNERDTIGE